MMAHDVELGRQQAIELLRECQAFIQTLMPRVLESRYDISYKDDNSPVTKADIYIEQQLSSWFAARVAGLRIVGEESYQHDFRAAEGYLLLLDPIDGTENFCSGLKEWGISVGIWKGQQHLASMLYLPELDEQLITGDSIRYTSSRITGFSSSFHEDIASGIREAQEYRVTGCSVYNIYNVVRGAFRRFCNPKGAYIWDVLPGVMLAIEHGCEVVVDGEQFDGRFLEPDRKYRIDIRNRHDLHSG